MLKTIRNILTAALVGLSAPGLHQCQAATFTTPPTYTYGSTQIQAAGSQSVWLINGILVNAPQYSGEYTVGGANWGPATDTYLQDTSGFDSPVCLGVAWLIGSGLSVTFYTALVPIPTYKGTTCRWGVNSPPYGYVIISTAASEPFYQGTGIPGSSGLGSQYSPLVVQGSVQAYNPTMIWNGTTAGECDNYQGGCDVTLGIAPSAAQQQAIIAEFLADKIDLKGTKNNAPYGMVALQGCGTCANDWRVDGYQTPLCDPASIASDPLIAKAPYLLGGIYCGSAGTAIEQVNLTVNEAEAGSGTGTPGSADATTMGAQCGAGTGAKSTLGSSTDGADLTSVRQATAVNSCVVGR